MARHGELVIQITEQEVMAQGGQKRYTSLVAFIRTHVNLYPRS